MIIKQILRMIMAPIRTTSLTLHWCKSQNIFFFYIFNDALIFKMIFLIVTTAHVNIIVLVPVRTDILSTSLSNWHHQLNPMSFSTGVLHQLNLVLDGNSYGLNHTWAMHIGMSYVFRQPGSSHYRILQALPTVEHVVLDAPNYHLSRSC